MIMKRIVLVIMSVYSLASFAQDMHFAQFYNTPLAINPSLAGGYDGTFRGILNYRDQWKSAGNAYKTYGLSLDGGMLRKVDKGFLGVGAAIYNDKQGDIGLSRMNAKLSLAYHVQMSRQQFFTVGMSGGVLQTSINRSNLIWDDQYDGNGYNPNLPSNEALIQPNNVSSDFSLGFNYVYKENEYAGNKKILFGGAVHNLVKVNDAVLSDMKKKRSLRYVLHTQMSFPIDGTNLTIQPSGFVALQGTSQEVFLGSNVRYELRQASKFTEFATTQAITFGVFARELKSIVAFAGLQMDKFNIGLSYDINISGYAVATNGKGGFEITLKYLNLSKFKNVYTPAPRL